VDGVRRTVSRLAAPLLTVLGAALAMSMLAGTGAQAAAVSRPASVAKLAVASGRASAVGRTALTPSPHLVRNGATGRFAYPLLTAATPARHVIVVGLGGLAWSDITPAATPGIWHLAERGSVGSLRDSGVWPRACPADGWLILNGAARAAVSGGVAGPCPATPPVIPPGPGPGPARIPAMPALVSRNRAYLSQPDWGLLATAPGHGGCATAVGPGAGLALASPAGRVGSYLPSPGDLSRGILARCPLTVIDLGNLPNPAAGVSAPSGVTSRSAARRAADRARAAITSNLPANSTLVLLSPGGYAPGLRVIVVAGPGFSHGLLTSASTRRPGLILLTDVTPTILHWFGTPVPSNAVGAVLGSAPRSTLAATAAALRGQEVAAQVGWSTTSTFFLVIRLGYLAAVTLIWFLPWGPGRRRTVARTAAAAAASLPASTFLASLLPWWSMSHPAAAEYALAAGWAILIAALALAGPWRRDPLGPAGVVATITLGVIVVDLLTGSHLQRESPFGLAVDAGRYYGLGNYAVGTYAASGVMCVAWAGSALLRRERRSRALVLMSLIAALTIIAAGWPGFGAKVGGTIAMVPAFGVLLAAAAGVRVTGRHAAVIAVSGLAVVVAFALVSYFLPVAGPSDISGFVGRSLHGGAGIILARKAHSNLASLGTSPFVLIVPVLVAALGVVIAWPGRVRARLLVCAYEEIPLLRPAFSAIWLAGVLGWFAEDSGVIVPSAALLFVLPLAVAILSSLPERAGSDSPEPGGTGDRAVSGSGPSGYV
jgi:hypothetical protein